MIKSIKFPTVFVIILATIIIVTVIYALSTSVTAFGLYNPSWEGATELRSQASAVDSQAIIATSMVDYKTVQASTTIIIILSPDRSYSVSETTQLRSFVRNGGTLVLSEDFGPHANPLLASIGANSRFDGRVLRDKRFNAGNQNLTVSKNISEHAYTKGVNQIAFNHGTSIEPNGATVLATSSGFSYLDGNNNKQLDDSEKLRARSVITLERVGQGIIVVVGDPSIFTNTMIERSQNEQFLRNMLNSHSRVVLDYSHSETLAPLGYVLKTIRQNLIYQITLGLIGLGTIISVFNYNTN